MVKGTLALSLNVWICQRRIYSYFECVHINELKEKKKRSEEKETNNAKRKAQREVHREAEMPWGRIWVKPLMTPLLYPLVWNSRIGGVLNSGSF